MELILSLHGPVLYFLKPGLGVGGQGAVPQSAGGNVAKQVLLEPVLVFFKPHGLGWVEPWRAGALSPSKPKQAISFGMYSVWAGLKAEDQRNCLITTQASIEEEPWPQKSI